MTNQKFIPRKNEKAAIFEEYMKKNDLNFFRRRDVHDGMDTVAFNTAIPAQGNHRLVAAVLTNNSMYTLLRIHLGLAPTGPARDTFLVFIGRLNAEQSVFKYIVEDDNNAFLDFRTQGRFIFLFDLYLRFPEAHAAACPGDDARKYRFEIRRLPKGENNGI